MPLDFSLSDEQKLIKETARGLFTPFLPRKEEFRRMILKEREFPQEIWDALAQAGFLGCLIPEEYGGSGLGLLPLTFAIEEMAAVGFGDSILILTAMDSACLVRCGSTELKRRFLPPVAQGKMKLCFAVTEPNAGSNTFRIETLARRDGQDYVLSGEKTFITGADVADYMLLVVRTTSREEVIRQGLPKAFGLSLLMVDCKSPGIQLTELPTRGIEGRRQYSVFFNGTRVPIGNLIGEENAGTMVLFNSLNPERILAAATCTGITRQMIAKASAYARERKVFGDRPIGSHQAIQHPLAELQIEHDAAQLLTYRAAWAFDAEQHPGVVGSYANMAKYYASNLAIRAVDRAIQTHGGYGFSEDYGLIHYWEAVRLVRTAPITNEMILNYVAEHTLGLPRSY